MVMPFDFELLLEAFGSFFRAFSGYIMSTGLLDSARHFQ